LDEVKDRRHRHAAPLGDARPALDAEVLRDLLVVPEGPKVVEPELDRVLDKAVNPQSPRREAFVVEAPVLGSGGEGAVVPEVRGDVLLAVLAGHGVHVERRSHHCLGRRRES
jgi:hypothetical protein